MRARLAKAWSGLTDVFWVLPAAIIIACALLALTLLQIDGRGLVPKSLIESPFVYSGGATGARTLLGAVASSTIGVAGTVFSITIAALSLAAGQMGPRLLRNFTRDRGNQTTLGTFLGTFTYALIVLRTVRDDGGDTFIPHLALSVGMALAFVSVGMLVYFVEHIAGRINVDTVIEIVFEDVERAMRKLTTEGPPPRLADGYDFSGGQVITDERCGFLQHLDDSGLADWATENATVIHLLVRPGDYIFPGAPIAVVKPPVDGGETAIKHATALGSQRVSTQDLEFAVRQLEGGGGARAVARYQRPTYGDERAGAFRHRAVRARRSPPAGRRRAARRAAGPDPILGELRRIDGCHVPHDPPERGRFDSRSLHGARRDHRGGERRPSRATSRHPAASRRPLDRRCETRHRQPVRPGGCRATLRRLRR